MLPEWSSLHPLVVHFPIALLLFAGALALASLARAAWLRPLAAAAILALLAGVASAWLAVATGRAAVHKTGNLPDAVYAGVERHEELAESTAWLFSGGAAVYTIAIAVPALRARLAVGRRRLALLVVLALVFGLGAWELVRAAHLGGVLVHRHGVRAKL